MSETLLYECGTPLLYEANALSGNNGKPILGKLHAPFFDLNNTTRNGRDYSKVAKEALESPEFQEKIATRTFFGRLGHPMTDDEAIEDPAVRACVILTDVSMNKKTNMYEGTLEIINNVYGQQLKSLIDAGCIMGVSTRGTGEVRRTGDKTSVVLPGTYEFEALDVVTLPAVKSARCVVLESKGKTRENILTENKVLNLIEDTDYTEVQVFESLKTSIESSDLKHKDLLIEGINKKLEEKDSYLFGTVKSMILEAEDLEAGDKEAEDFAKDEKEFDDVVKEVEKNVAVINEKAKANAKAEEAEEVNTDSASEENKEAETETETSEENTEDTVTETETPETTESTEPITDGDKLEKEDLNDPEVQKEMTDAIVEETGASQQQAEEFVKEETKNMQDNAEQVTESKMNESETIESLVNTITELSEKLAKAQSSIAALQESKTKLTEAEEEEEAPAEDETITTEEEPTDNTEEDVKEEEEKDAGEANQELINVFINSVKDLKSQVKDLQTQVGELSEENSDIATENEEKVEECVTLRKTLRKQAEMLEALKKEYVSKFDEVQGQYNSLKESYDSLKAENIQMKNTVIESVAKANRISVNDLKARVSINESIDKISTTAKSIRESMDRQHIFGINSISEVGRTLSRQEYQESYGKQNDSQDTGSSRFGKTFQELIK